MLPPKKRKKLRRSERAELIFLETLLESGSANIYEVAELLGWSQRGVASVARRLVKTKRVSRVGEGVIGDPYRYTVTALGVHDISQVRGVEWGQMKPFTILTADNCPRCNTLKRMLEQPLKGKYDDRVEYLKREQDPERYDELKELANAWSLPIIVRSRDAASLAGEISLGELRRFLTE